MQRGAQAEGAGPIQKEEEGGSFREWLRVVLGWVESYQISGTLHLGGLDVLEEGVGGWGVERDKKKRTKK